MIAIDDSALDLVQGQVQAFVRGEHDLSGLELYYLLERTTRLHELHTMLRSGAHNLTRAGLPQSYGEHNRLLLHGLDRLLASDLDWYRTRLREPADVSDGRLLDCFAAVRSLGLGRDTKLALWLGASLHDCGMLGGHQRGVDVEDAVALGGRVLEVLCPPHLIPLASFAIRNHDYIKDVFRGEVPAGFVADQLATLPADQRDTALAVLGMIQVAGAASLGEGQLSAFRLSIFRRCIDGTALDDRSVRTRLARLLAPDHEATASPPTDGADEVLASLPADERARLERFLERVPTHRWHDATDATAKEKAGVLRDLSSLWHRKPTDHVVLAPGVELATAAEERLQNGSVALIVG